MVDAGGRSFRDLTAPLKHGIRTRLARVGKLKALMSHRLSSRWRRVTELQAFRTQFKNQGFIIYDSDLLLPVPRNASDTGPGQSALHEGTPSWHAEALVRELYGTLTATQRSEICRPWDFVDERFGLTRSFVSNHWQVTAPCVASTFFDRQQQALIAEIFRNLVDPAWHGRFLKQLIDDTKGHPFGQDQSIAIIGDPQNGPFQFLFTGRHLTLRADGGTSPGLAFGGPIVYGHAAGGRFAEKPGHPGNVFWPQAIVAGRVYALLTPQQKSQAVVSSLPGEHEIGFRPSSQGVRVATFSMEQRSALVFLLQALMAPFRSEERERILQCLQNQGGLDVLKLAFSTAKRMSAPEWDVWRLEGPSFVWHFQGHPHVHCWVHIAAEAQGEPVNSHRGAFLFSHHDPLH